GELDGPVERAPCQQVLRLDRVADQGQAAEVVDAALLPESGDGGQVLPGRPVPDHRVITEPKPAQGVLGVDALVVGADPEGGEGVEDRFPRAGAVALDRETPDVGARGQRLDPGMAADDLHPVGLAYAGDA